MSNLDLLGHIERTLHSVRQGHLTSSEGAQRVERCLDQLTGLPADAAGELHGVVRELRRMRWDGGGDYAAALDALSARVESIGASVNGRG